MAARPSLLRILRHPLRYAQERINAWVLARVRRQSGPVVIPRHRVYIIPTRFGAGFGLMAVVMLLAAMNYSNSMAFALTFLLAGLGLVCMYHTHANLVNLVVRAARAPSVFAGELAHFELQIENPSRRPRFSVGGSWALEPQPQVQVDVTAQDQAVLRLSLPARRRGWLPAGVFSISTEYPLGLFHAWTWMELDLSCLVYPQPASPGEEPPASTGQGDISSAEQAGQEEFAGLRHYRHGDPLRSIHWKSFARLRTPMVKQFTETLEQELWLDWDSLSGAGVEERLSQLTRWVLDAEAGHRPYGLRLPGLRLRPQRGEPHAQACLRALALFEAA